MNEVVPATLEHAEALAPRLRRADVAEIKAASGELPEDSLVIATAQSVKAWAWLKDGEVGGMFGVAPFPHRPGVGVPWLLCADGATDGSTIAFLRKCRGFVDEMLEAFPQLVNYVDCRNTVSIQWLHWVGFSLCEVEPFYGVQRLPFIRFAISRRTPVCANP